MTNLARMVAWLCAYWRRPFICEMHSNTTLSFSFESSGHWIRSSLFLTLDELIIELEAFWSNRHIIRVIAWWPSSHAYRVILGPEICHILRCWLIFEFSTVILNYHHHLWCLIQYAHELLEQRNLEKIREIVASEIRSSLLRKEWNFLRSILDPFFHPPRTLRIREVNTKRWRR